MGSCIWGKCHKFRSAYYAEKDGPQLVYIIIVKDFDTGKKPSEAKEPERFYHGFVLGLIVDLEDRYQITSNRESGFGRYDVVVEPKEKADPAIIMEFKIQDQDEKDLSQTVEAALSQIETKNYASGLIGKGIQPERIRKYGFAFRGKEILIGERK